MVRHTHQRKPIEDSASHNVDRSAPKLLYYCHPPLQCFSVRRAKFLLVAYIVSALVPLGYLYLYISRYDSLARCCKDVLYVREDDDATRDREEDGGKWKGSDRSVDHMLAANDRSHCMSSPYSHKSESTSSRHSSLLRQSDVFNT